MNKKELDKMWNEAATPEAHKLNGWYEVKILSGPGKIAGFFTRRWLKVLHKTTGNNCVDGKKEGHFLLSQAEDSVLLNYDLPNNNFTWRRVKDYVRRVDNETLIGQLNIKGWKKYHFAGYFTLTLIYDSKGQNLVEEIGKSCVVKF